MNNEVELIKTTDYVLKDSIVRELIKERISYLQKEKVLFSLIGLYKKSKTVYCIYVDKNQIEQAREIINKNTYDTR